MNIKYKLSFLEFLRKVNKNIRIELFEWMEQRPQRVLTQQNHKREIAAAWHNKSISKFAFLLTCFEVLLKNRLYKY